MKPSKQTTGSLIDLVPLIVVLFVLVLTLIFGSHSQDKREEKLQEIEKQCRTDCENSGGTFIKATVTFDTQSDTPSRCICTYNDGMRNIW